MKRVYCAKDPLMVGHLRNVLALHGIECMTRKLDLTTAAGRVAARRMLAGAMDYGG